MYRSCSFPFCCADFVNPADSYFLAIPAVTMEYFVAREEINENMSVCNHCITGRNFQVQNSLLMRMFIFSVRWMFKVIYDLIFLTTIKSFSFANYSNESNHPPFCSR
jgi:hypothetical protein